ncbi:MAG: hypothetical protein K9H26_14300 [Prolixibacteraceae bacterium]|nr:hypothetical protein [Prolixibacteraceae bacterium]
MNRHEILYMLFTFILLGAVTACNNKNAEPNDPVIAIVMDKNLRYSQLQDDFPQMITGNDSIEFVNDYINKWIKQELLVAEAEKKLTSEQLKIEKEIEKYRQELIIFHYKKKRYSEILNRQITDEEIQDFYQQNIDKYILSEPIVQVSYIIFPVGVNVPDDVKKSLTSNREKDIQKYEEFVYGFAKKYDNFNNKWLYLNNLLQQANTKLPNPEAYLKQHKLIEAENNDEQHLIAIKKYMLPGQHAPIEFVTPQIKGSIINHEKLDFLREIKDSLYNDALKYNKFRVYNKNS